MICIRFSQLGNFISTYWENILLVLSPFFVLLISYFIGFWWKLPKKLFFTILFPTTLVSVVTGVFDIYQIYESIGVKACAELTGVTATVLTIITTIFGYFYNKSQSKIQSIHAESEWRKRLLDLEKKPFYTTNDLLELNSFINPYHKKHGKDNLDIYINKVIVDCIKNLNDDNNNIDDSTIEKSYKIENYLNPILFGKPKKNSESNKDNTEKSTLWDIWPKNMCPYCDLILTDENDTIKIRRCIHALLKDDWEKNVRQHTFYKE